MRFRACCPSCGASSLLDLCGRSARRPAAARHRVLEAARGVGAFGNARDRVPHDDGGGVRGRPHVRGTPALGGRLPSTAAPCHGKPMTVRFFDVGEGLAALVVLPDGRRVLVDAGDGSEADRAAASPAYEAPATSGTRCEGAAETARASTFCGSPTSTRTTSAARPRSSRLSPRACTSTTGVSRESRRYAAREPRRPATAPAWPSSTPRTERCRSRDRPTSR